MVSKKVKVIDLSDDWHTGVKIDNDLKEKGYTVNTYSTKVDAIVIIPPRNKFSFNLSEIDDAYKRSIKHFHKESYKLFGVYKRKLDGEIGYYPIQINDQGHVTQLSDYKLKRLDEYMESLVLTKESSGDFKWNEENHISSYNNAIAHSIDYDAIEKKIREKITNEPLNRINEGIDRIIKENKLDEYLYASF